MPPWTPCSRRSSVRHLGRINVNRVEDENAARESGVDANGKDGYERARGVVVDSGRRRRLPASPTDRGVVCHWQPKRPESDRSDRHSILILQLNNILAQTS